MLAAYSIGLITLLLTGSQGVGKPRPPDQVVAGTVGARAYAGLAAFYIDADRRPPIEDVLDSLISDRPTTAKTAADYLLALYQQSLADERNGRVRWVQTPYWGGSPESEARRFREALAEEIGGQAEGRSAVEIVEWGLAHEPLAELQGSLAQALPRLPPRDVEALLGRLLSGPHPNGNVLKFALSAVSRHHLVVLRERLSPLFQDPRRSVRDSARAVAGRLGVRAIPPFDPTAAFSPELDHVLRSVAARVMHPIPPQGRWCRFEPSSRLPALGGTTRDTVHGWLDLEHADSLHVIRGDGVAVVLSRAQTHVVDESLAEYARSLIGLRERDATQLSGGGMLTAQFEPRDVALVEANVAAWCYLNGERGAAAELLFPRLDALQSLADFDALDRELAGDQAHLAMVDAFSYDRDYETAIALGEHLARREFDGYGYQARGRELAAQLRRRHDDFGALALPDSASWDSLQHRMSRGDQIRYLAARVRLINAFQLGQPGGVSLAEEQYADPTHLRFSFDERENPSRRVINPLVELERLGLALQDVPTLLPFLGDRNFLPTFEFWRDFDPDRHLFRVCEVIEHGINAMARRPLVDAEAYDRMSEIDRACFRDRVLSWCRDHAGRGVADLDLETLETTTEQSVFLRTSESLARAGEGRAVPILLRRLDDFPAIRSEVLTALRTLHAAEAVPRARSWVTHPFDGIPVPRENGGLRQFTSDRIRFEAALILLQRAAPGTHEGWETMRTLLEPDPEHFWRWLAARPLLETGDSLALAWLCDSLGRGGYTFNKGDRMSIYGDLVRSGCEPLLSKLFDDLSSDSVVDSATFVSGHFGSRVYVAGDRAANILAPLTGGSPVYEAAAEDTTRAVQRLRLRRWLADRITRMHSGARPDSLFR